MAKLCSNCGSKIGFLDQDLKFKDKKYICGKCISKYKFSKNDKSDTATWAAISWATDHNYEDFENMLSNNKTFQDIVQELETEKELKKEKKEDEKLKKKKEKEHKKQIRQEKARQEYEDQQKKKEEYKRVLDTFKQSDAKKFSHYYFDLKSKKILCAKTLLTDYRVLEFKDIISYQVNEKGHNESKKHGITRALVGGAIAGGAGAIVGAMTGGKNYEYIDHLGLIINLSDGSNFEVTFLRGKEKANGFIVKGATSEMNSLISIIQAGMQKQSNESISTKTNNDIPDQLRKYKKLADDGIITQDEFEAKKKQLLGLN